MLRRPPRSTRTDTLFPYTTLFRSQVNLIEGILREAAHANDPSRLKPLRERFIAAKSSLLENLAIAAGSEAKQLGTLAGELPQHGEGAGNILELRPPELSAETDAEVVTDNRPRSSADIADAVDRLAWSTGDKIT